MKEDKIAEILGSDYEIVLSGAHVAYILKLLAQEQFVLNRAAEDNVVDIMAHSLAAANDIVGNTLLHEAYRACGPSFIAFAMNIDEASAKKFMESKTPDELKTRGEEIAIKSQKNMKKRMN